MATEQEQARARAELTRIAKAIVQLNQVIALRDEAIVKARQAGIQQKEIMPIFGMSRETVRRIERQLGYKETASA